MENLTCIAWGDLREDKAKRQNHPDCPVVVTDASACAVPVTVPLPAVCPCGCRVCKDSWFADGMPIIKNGQITRDERTRKSEAPSDLGKGIAAAKEIAEAADLRKRAFDLYRGPFRYEKGYIWDKDNEMVADDHIEKAVPALEVRGWGRMKYFANSAALQDAVGVLMAEALTVYWKREFERRRSR